VTVPISAEELLGQLRETVRCLAQPAEEQVRWLEENRLPPDELALELDDEVPGWFSRLERHGLLSEAAKASLVALNDRLGEIDADSDAWRREGMAASPEWAHVRELAAAALRLL
jgi:hypothetical protein